jgi:hypothetical protein
MSNWREDVRDACSTINNVVTHLRKKSQAFSQIGNDNMAFELAMNAQSLIEANGKIGRAIDEHLDEELRETNKLHDTVVMPIVKGEIKISKGED